MIFIKNKSQRKIMVRKNTSQDRKNWRQTPAQRIRQQWRNVRTSKKGAYKPKNKAITKNAIRPFRETKRIKGSDIALLSQGNYPDPRILAQTNNVFYNISPMSYNFKIQGLGDNAMIGQSTFNQYLKQKIIITFPQGENIPIVPMEAWIIQGWVKRSISSSTVTGGGGIEPDTVVPQNFYDLIATQIKHDFNEQKDLLEFVPKQERSYFITRRQLIVPRKKDNTWTSARNSLGAGPIDGYPADAQVMPNSRVYNLSWKCNRKIHHTEGAPLYSTSVDPYYFNDFGWVPFSFVYQPQFAQVVQYGELSIQYDDQCWYSDM